MKLTLDFLDKMKGEKMVFRLSRAKARFTTIIDKWSIMIEKKTPVKTLAKRVFVTFGDFIL